VIEANSVPASPTTHRASEPDVKLGAMHLNLSADELLTTTRSVRKRLDFDRRLDRAVIEECLELALQAPTGGNRQAWHWLVVADEAKRRAIGEIYKANFAIYRTLPRPEYDAEDTRGKRFERVADSAQYLADNMHRAPLLVIPCMWGRFEESPTAMVAGAWGSLLPAVWSLMLALRERGLGSAWTTIHLIGDGEQRVAELLGIPFEKATQAALLPVAHTVGTDFRPAKRQPLADVLHWDSW
jgi:nitroreductase